MEAKREVLLLMVLFADQIKLQFTHDQFRRISEGTAGEKVTGDFHPFATGDIDEVETYIRQIVGRLINNEKIVVEPDFEIMEVYAVHFGF